MKKITLLIMLLAVSFGYAQNNLPFDFDGTIYGFTTTDGATVSNGTGSDVLEIVGPVADWDRAQVTFTDPIDLSDADNNTLRFTIQSTTAAPGEVHQHGVSFQNADGSGAIEMNFITTGTTVHNIQLDFDSGHTTRPTMHIFTDVGDFGSQNGTGGQSGMGSAGLSGTYIIDDISLGADPVGADATLSDLQVDAATISGFASNTQDYVYAVPVGTSVVPAVTATTTDGGASVVIIPAASIPGNTTVEVTAADGMTTITYTVSFVFPIEFPFDFEGSVQNWIGDGGPVVTNGAGNDVLNVVAGVGDWDNIQVTFTTPIDLSDDANNTLRFSIQSTTAMPGEVRQHGVSFQSPNVGSYEANFQTTGTDVLEVALDFVAGLDPRDKLVIFTDVGDLGAVQASPNVNGTDTRGLSGTYIIDNITLGATVLSIDDFRTVDFNVYPNPTNTVWNVRSTQNIETIEVFDVLGKKVISLTPNSETASIDASGLNNGIYFARLNSNTGTQTVKLVKE